MDRPEGLSVRASPREPLSVQGDPRCHPEPFTPLRINSANGLLGMARAVGLFQAELVDDLHAQAVAIEWRLRRQALCGAARVCRVERPAEAIGFSY